ncbi:hypothetical protein K502DRAFT_353144 [Neoconidiobolus thromboides FSU 785]|nr:hypothetical protein K502DRAFT_353144 [Neoconidiobolus thromboides FSU 785]
MKPTIIYSFLLALTTATELTIVNPWAESKWNSGDMAVINYTVDENKGDYKYTTISLDLMSGDPNDGLLILSINGGMEVNTKNITWKVEDLPSNKDYFLRLGNEDRWVFSHTFEIHGSGKYQLPKKPVFIQDNEESEKKYLKQEVSESPSASSSSSSVMSSTSSNVSSTKHDDKSSFKSDKPSSKGGKSSNGSKLSFNLLASCVFFLPFIRVGAN